MAPPAAPESGRRASGAGWQAPGCWPPLRLTWRVPQHLWLPRRAGRWSRSRGVCDLLGDGFFRRAPFWPVLSSRVLFGGLPSWRGPFSRRPFSPPFGGAFFAGCRLLAAPFPRPVAGSAGGRLRGVLGGGSGAGSGVVVRSILRVCHPAAPLQLSRSCQRHRSSNPIMPGVARGWAGTAGQACFAAAHSAPPPTSDHRAEHKGPDRDIVAARRRARAAGPGRARAGHGQPKRPRPGHHVAVGRRHPVVDRVVARRAQWPQRRCRRPRPAPAGRPTDHRLPSGPTTVIAANVVCKSLVEGRADPGGTGAEDALSAGSADTRAACALADSARSAWRSTATSGQQQRRHGEGAGRLMAVGRSVRDRRPARRPAEPRRPRIRRCCRPTLRGCALGGGRRRRWRPGGRWLGDGRASGAVARVSVGAGCSGSLPPGSVRLIPFHHRCRRRRSGWPGS